ncbi:MAG: hypothetical protein WCK92_15600 [Bacteroidota bacterium]
MKRNRKHVLSEATYKSGPGCSERSNSHKPHQVNEENRSGGVRLRATGAAAM